MTSEQEQQSFTWPQDDSMTSGIGDDEFSKFLDLDSDFQYSGLDNGSSGLDTPMGRLGFGQQPQMTMQSLAYNNSQSANLNIPAAVSQAQYSNHIPPSHQFDGPFQQYHHMRMPHNYHVPPTPVSSEVPASKYGQMENGGQLRFDRHTISFTPLVSPAQTPLHGGFLPEFGNADDFFSPLTSPALEAQNQFSTSTTASPVDLNPDPKPPSASTRGRRKGSVSLRTQTRSVKVSPMVKPQTRRRQNTSKTLSTDKLGASTPPLKSGQALQPQAPAHRSRSSDDSVSPVPLSESVMGPPPVPTSVHKSPSGLGLLQSSDSTNPVTPATLMRLPKDATSQIGEKPGQISEQMPGDGIEDIMLPDAAAPVIDMPFDKQSSRIESNGDHETPTLAAKTPKLSATSTPRGVIDKNNSQESFSKPTASGRGGRGSKKRQSTSSATVSPALRPKISPNINPLVPASGPGMGHISAETSALYLASKSNYQNIIDGTHLPGVSYPEALAENLSSKRTSHKIAEQGRRNRINLALKEIEALLPPSIIDNAKKGDKAAGSPDEIPPTPGGSKTIQGTSKASTVEMAIVYIKTLQDELAMTKGRLETAEKKLADAQDEASNGSSAGESQTSE